MKITRSLIIERFHENQLPFVELPLSNGVSILISQFCGRILGPFLDADGESLFWINPAFGDPDAFRTLVATDWNLGGDRFWVAPEIQYLTRDRRDYWGTNFIPREMDPGRWQLEPVGTERWRLHQELTLEAFNLSEGLKDLSMEVLVYRVEDPLRFVKDYPALVEGVIYAGYEQEVTLCDKKNDDTLSAVWNVIQVRAGGEVSIPTTPMAVITNYMEPIEARFQEVHPNHVRLRITGDRCYKVGYKAAHVFGRLAYLHKHDSERSCLIIRHFSNHPSAEYPEEPPESPGMKGDSIFIYNDDGMYGGFGELECLGQTIGGRTGKSCTTDWFECWLYVGKIEKLRRIAWHLLGVEV